MVGVIAMAMAAMTSTASAGIVITQSVAPAPTYTNTLTFDEPGGATGTNVPNDSWSVSHGIPLIYSGEGSNFVGDLSGVTGQGTNSYYGPYGVFIEFGQDLTTASFQGFDSSGPPTFSGGGAAAVALNDGVEVEFLFVTPSWGGFGGGSWYNLTTNGGSVFDEIRFLGFGFFPESVVDNVSWNAVPEPTSLALFALTGVAVLARRRR